MNSEIRKAMRYGTADDNIALAYYMAEDPLRPDLCNRWFTIYVGNGYSNPAFNTIEGRRDVRICEKFLHGFCHRQFYGGQMEQVLYDLVAVSYIRTPAEVLQIVGELRKMGITGEIRLEAEYVEGYPVSIKTY